MPCFTVLAIAKDPIALLKKWTRKGETWSWIDWKTPGHHSEPDPANPFVIISSCYVKGGAFIGQWFSTVFNDEAIWQKFVSDLRKDGREFNLKEKVVWVKDAHL